MTSYFSCVYQADGRIVTHGLMSRVFLMKWYHFSVEYFEDLRNVNHCEFLIMRKHEDSGKYILENKLRTWSDLKRERLEKEKAEKEARGEKATLTGDTGEVTTGTKLGDLQPSTSTPKKKQWGGCPNGCDHGRFYYRRENGVASHNASSSALHETPPVRRAFHMRFQSSSEEDEDDPRGRLAAPPKLDGRSSDEEGDGNGKTMRGVQRSLDGMLLSDTKDADTQPSHRSKPRDKGVTAVLYTGRDFGGSASGNTSRATSDAEAEADTEGLGRGADGRRRTKSKREKRERYGDSGMGRGARADALGDQSGDEEGETCAKCGGARHEGGNGSHQWKGKGNRQEHASQRDHRYEDASETEKEEETEKDKEEQSVHGSVY